MRVIKRSGIYETVSFDKVLRRIKKLCDEGNLSVDPAVVSQKVCSCIYDKVKTSELDTEAAKVCTNMVIDNKEYGELASRIIISNHHKNTSPSFSETMCSLYYNKDINGKDSPLVSEEFWNVVSSNKEKLNSVINYDKDYLFDYFGFKTLEKSYLMKVNNKVIERPQHMIMRICIGIHFEDLKSVIESYNLISNKYFTHATPTLYNAGTPRPQLSSCFLLAMKDDSIDGIYSTLKDCALISKWAGGIGLHIHNIRVKGSRIRGTNGEGTGIVPMLQVFNRTAKYVNQGGRRNGSFAIYLEPWHGDILDFLQMRKNHGDEEMRARELFYALWIPDLFMKRTKENGDWSLFCPDSAPGLSDVYGDEFNKLYEKYEKEGKAIKTMKAQKLWFEILSSQIETGTPYMLYKDSCNQKSNQKNLGTIKSSNLCAEIIEYSNSEETAVSNLGSICLPSFVKKTKYVGSINEIFYKTEFDFNKLYEVTKVLTKNLNRVIDHNFYPTIETKTSNMRHRPIGIGVQGLADVFIMMRFPFTSDKAKKLNKDIFETIYYSALESSCELAEIEGPYSTFKGSPASEGILQFDMWNVLPSCIDESKWNELKSKIIKYGLRNSLLVAPMPTASTAQIMGNNEAIEPYTSNFYVRRVLAGEFIVANKHLLNDLQTLGIWNKNMKDRILSNNGSIQDINEIPNDIKEIYKTVWELKMKDIIDMAADRGAFICQSQSLNLFVENPDFKTLTSMHFYAWNKGLKCGQYYLRTKAKAATQKFTIAPSNSQESEEESECEACGS